MVAVRHLVFECASLAALQAEYADLLTATTDTMRCFCAGGSPEGLWLCHRLLEFHQRIEFATGWHMRSDLLLADACTILLLQKFFVSGMSVGTLSNCRVQGCT